MKNKDLKSNNLTYIINEIEYTINKLVLKHSSLKPKFKSKSKSKIDPVTSLDKMIEKSVVKIIEKEFSKSLNNWRRIRSKIRKIRIYLDY